MNIALWIIQVLLALLFLFGGGTKLVLPLETLMPPDYNPRIHIPFWFLRFIGVCEFLGGLGLILPAVLRIKPFLVPLAAVCLSIIMIGAVVITAINDGPKAAIVPFITGVLLLFVAYGRTKIAPHRAR